MSGDDLHWGLLGVTVVVCNDYEFELIRQKTGLDEARVLDETEALVITRGEHGCSVYEARGRTDVPAIPPARIVDPTGVGDAFRGGFMKGMAQELDYVLCAKLGAVAAAYALEHLGGQSHSYGWQEFRERFDLHFGAIGTSID
jgi:adenosine kinase